MTRPARGIRIDRLERLINDSLAWNERGIAIRACTTKEALECGISYQEMDKDHPHIHPRNEWHDQLSWVACITHGCLIHLKDKVEHNTFPVRTAYSDMTTTCARSQTRDWRVTTRFRSLQITLLAPHPRTPEDCKLGKSFRQCESIHCQVHVNHKLDEWSRKKRLERRCDAMSPLNCVDISCVTHKCRNSTTGTR